MPGLSLSSHNLKKHRLIHRPLYALAVMMLFWGTFDGFFSYVTPLLIGEAGFTKTVMGLIIGTSSVAGAIFDFLLCRFLNKANFRRIFMAMFAICFFYPFVLWSAKTVWLYLFAMALWGIYYDLRNFGTFDFVGRYTKHEEHSSSFGIVQVFQSLGYVIAPLVAGALIGVSVGWKPFAFAWFFLAVSFCFYLVLMGLTNKKRYMADGTDEPEGKSVPYEIRVWRKILSLVFPVLALTMFLSILDSFFWMIGPIIAKGFSENFHQLEGVVLTAYQLPSLLVGWFVGQIVLRYGKKRTAYLALLVGSLFLSFFSYVSNPFALVGLIFLVSLFSSLAWPSINGAYADYISEAPGVEREIEGVEDFFINSGYFIGPILAGFLADNFGNSAAFSFLGFAGIALSLLLLRFSPKSIDVREAQKVR